MKFFLKRIDDREDSYTKMKFNTYEEAYDFLEKVMGQTCCSDTDFDKNFYYNIFEYKI